MKGELWTLFLTTFFILWCAYLWVISADKFGALRYLKNGLAQKTKYVYVHCRRVVRWLFS